MMAAPIYGVGEKDGLFIHELPQHIRVYDYGRTVDCFKVNTLKGYMYGLEHGTSPAAWVVPIDSTRYNHYADDITALIDSLYQAGPLLSQESYGTFVFPDNFTEINYYRGQIRYEDSIRYDIDIIENDSLHVTIFDENFTRLSFPKDSVVDLSPKSVRLFINNLKSTQK